MEPLGRASSSAGAAPRGPHRDRAKHRCPLPAFACRSGFPITHPPSLFELPATILALSQTPPGRPCPRHSRRFDCGGLQRLQHSLLSARSLHAHLSGAGSGSWARNHHPDRDPVTGRFSDPRGGGICKPIPDGSLWHAHSPVGAASGF